MSNHFSSYVQNTATGLAIREETPFLRGGVQLDGTESLYEAAAKADLAWEYRKTPMGVMNPDGTFQKSDKVFAYVRSDNGKVLPGFSVGSTHRPTQPMQALGIIEAAREQGLVTLNTLGHIGGGRRIFAVGELNRDPIQIKRRNGVTDEITQNVLIFCPNDGRKNVIGCFPHNLTCLNQLAATIGKLKTEWRIGHYTNHDSAMEDAKVVFELLAKAFGDLEDQYHWLQMKDMNVSEFKAFATEVLDEIRTPAPEGDSEEAQKKQARFERTRERELKELEHFFLYGTGNEGDNSRYAALQGLTEWIDHRETRLEEFKKRERTQEQHRRRFESSTWGSKRLVRDRAMAKLVRG